MRYTFILFIIGLVLTKNIFDLEKLKLGVEDSKKLQEQAEESNQKRKNTFNLESLKIGKSDKFKRKNTFKPVDFTIDKRKNTFNPSDFKIDKRKNTFNPSDFKIDKRSQDILSMNNILTTVLPQLKSISIFTSYLRDDVNLNNKFETEDSILIIAPTDEAISNLCLKPWEFPKEIKGDDKEENELVNFNIEHFIAGHMSTTFSNIDDVTLDNGKQINVVFDGTNYGIQVENDVVIDVIYAEKVKNGIILIINDTLVKPN
ncbi:unnamed protein product [Candida verbasci]|uniref:FAS1 domain-containing protein n=1 Tax=Candida verbasci TaxID=1227364 RepID=A0A9W4TV14_9ASCO|nr:unnamed protein product [Candida verbasci]